MHKDALVEVDYFNIHVGPYQYRKEKQKIRKAKLAYL